MGVKFAGSRSLDERRRRRLAGGNEQTSSEASKIAPDAGYWKIRPALSQTEQGPVSPLQSLIPRSRFRIWLLCVAVPLISLLFVLIAQGGSLISDQKIRALFDIQQTHLWRFIRGILFLGSAGLCWLVSWFRSASDRDFEGCYKSWYFSGWIFLIFGFVAGCDAHLTFSQILGDYIRIDNALLRTLIWAVPMSAFMVEPMRCFTREMWHCRRSFILMSLSCLASLAFLEMKVPFSESTSFYTSHNSLLIVAASVFVPALVFSALLSQVYYVMYVSSDPVPRRESWARLALSWGLQKTSSGLSIAVSYCFSTLKTASSSTKNRMKNQIEKVKKARVQKKALIVESKKASASETVPETGQQQSKPKHQKQSNPPAEPKNFKQRAADQHNKIHSESHPEPEVAPSEKPRIRLKSQTIKEQEVIAQSPISEIHQFEQPGSASESRSMQTNSEHVDPSNLKGLSKKERRRIRKLHREQQRAKAG